jgi:hypothetical protein
MACHRPPSLPNNIIHLNEISITSGKIRGENSWIKINISKKAFLEDNFRLEGRWHSIGHHCYQQTDNVSTRNPFLQKLLNVFCVSAPSAIKPSKHSLYLALLKFSKFTYDPQTPTGITPANDHLCHFCAGRRKER